MTCNSDARRAYKKQARADIRVKFWPTMGAVILELIPIVLIGMIMQIGIRGLSEYPTMEELLRVYKYLVIYVLAAFLIGGPITFGAKHYFVSRARGEQSSVSQVLICFTSFKKYVTALKLGLCILVRSLGWLALLYAVIFVTAIPVILIKSDIFLVIYMIVWIAVLVVMMLFVIVKVRRYDGAFICMIDTPDASVWEAVKACAPIFEGHNWELLIFDLSFILWELLSVITLGIVGIYTTAYTEIAFVHYFDDLCGKKIQQQQPEMPEL